MNIGVIEERFMNPYDNAVISVKKYESKGDRIYGELRSAEGELLVSASLEYITQILEQRMTKFEDKSRMQFENTTDEELLYLYKCKAQDMTYYQHAEGEAYWREKNSREKCSAELALIRKELYARGVGIPVVGYLV